jgi:aarF domain-containing kinase
LNFKNDDRLYVPEIYLDYSGKRMLVMEFIDNAFKVSETEEIKKKYGEEETKKIANTLIDIFSKMIFITGDIHADAHPGNILIREHPARKGKPQVVLIDHGLYCSLTDSFLHQFRELWWAMITFDNMKMKELAIEMGLGEQYRYLPLLFTYRTINSTKPLGDKFNQEEKSFIKDNDEMNFEKIGMLTEKLPANM